MTPGTLIAGRYRIEHFLGRGGMGAVYRAVDVQTGRTRAIKLMLEHKVEDADARERFRREAAVAGHIDSPLVVDVIDAGVASDTGTPYIVMELLEGENLEQRLARLGARPVTEVVDHLAQLARALQRMHARNVVHRDLKPSNLFLEEPDGAAPRIKVLDLGVAKVLSLTGSDTTAIVGSVPYMAPEQILGRAVGPAADLYALGLIAFTLLTGAPYWRKERDGEAIALAMKIADGVLEPASTRARELGVALPPAFDDWFAHATARQAARRFRSAAEAVHGLATALGIDLPPWDGDDPAPPAPAANLETLDALPARIVADVTESAGPQLGLAPTAVAPSASRLRSRRARALGLIALGAAALAWWLWPRRDPPAPSELPSPLARAGSVLACPVLEVDGDVKDWGWLGAAAASLACERARVVLGGLPSRTRAPAELLDLRGLRDVDDDPYGHGDARSRSLAAAQRSDLHLDGRISRLGSGSLVTGFRVELVIRDSDRTERKRGAGEGRGLHQAVRGAMTELIGQDGIPLASGPDPVVADYSRAADVTTMLRLLDWKLATQNNVDGVETECAWFAGDGVTDLASFVRYTCAFMRGNKPVTPAGPTANTPGAKAARARVQHMADRQDLPASIEELRVQYRAERSTWGRSVVAATLSCLLQAAAPDDALTWAKRAVEDEPRNPSGEWCAPWGQRMSLAADTDDEASAVVQWCAWAPWDSYAWRYAARSTVDPDRALWYARRAYALSPLDTGVASELTEQLLLRGNQRADVADIARRLGQSSYPVHQLVQRLLMVRARAREAKFGQALAVAGDAMRPQPNDAGWLNALRLELAWRAVEIANLLGRAEQLADRAIRELIDPEPFPLDLASLEQARQVTAICAYASRADAARCFARLHTRQSPLNPAFADGARRFAAGDLRGAAASWRPLVRDAREQVDLLAEAMIRAFSAAGEHELVSRIEERNRASAVLFNGATLATARAAQAARDRGDPQEARRLARLVLDAWADADTSPPILPEMRQLAR